jgi:hypothetical protein
MVPMLSMRVDSAASSAPSSPPPLKRGMMELDSGARGRADAVPLSLPPFSASFLYHSSEVLAVKMSHSPVLTFSVPPCHAPSPSKATMTRRRRRTTTTTPHHQERPHPSLFVKSVSANPVLTAAHAVPSRRAR